MDAGLSPLQKIGIRILNYLDNWLILAQSEAVSTSHKTLLLSHLCCLGLRVNFAKSILSPSQRLSFLGTVIDSVQMTATVSAERATMIQRHAASFKKGTARPLKALRDMLSLFSPKKRHHVLVRSDSRSVVSYMNHLGGLVPKHLCKLVNNLLVWAQTNLRSLKAKHVPGKNEPRSRHIVKEQRLFRIMDAPPALCSENLGSLW